MTPERERLVVAVQNASLEAALWAADDGRTTRQFVNARRRHQDAERALAAYDAAHPEEGK